MDEPMTNDEHKQNMVGKVIGRFVEHMHFRNILAVCMVLTMCYKELMGFVVSEQFYMLVGLIIGMYFSKDSK